MIKFCKENYLNNNHTQKAKKYNYKYYNAFNKHKNEKKLCA